LGLAKSKSKIPLRANCPSALAWLDSLLLLRVVHQPLSSYRNSLQRSI
jgi:hypothetical protein